MNLPRPTDAVGEHLLYYDFVVRIDSRIHQEKKMINFLIWIIVGALIGWVASLIMKTNSRQGLIADIIVGIVGAFVGGFFLSPMFGVSTINESNYSIPALLVSLGGAVILLAISKLFRNVAGFVVILIIILVIFIYFNCWPMASTSAFCTTVKSLPFLQ
jgi:uncharacterized membrane protein YeaQ/YmgE (transglycosylase-associated protein family)